LPNCWKNPVTPMMLCQKWEQHGPATTLTRTWYFLVRIASRRLQCFPVSRSTYKVNSYSWLSSRSHLGPHNPLVDKQCANSPNDIFSYHPFLVKSFVSCTC
jgi:hypothetical protein